MGSRVATLAALFSRVSFLAVSSFFAHRIIISYYAFWVKVVPAQSARGDVFFFLPFRRAFLARFRMRTRQWWSRVNVASGHLSGQRGDAL